MNISDYLNKRNLNINLNDSIFYRILDDLVDQLCDYDYHDYFSEGELRRDFQQLRQSICSGRLTSRHQHGIKVIKYFQPHIYEVEYVNGKSFSNLWKNKDILRKCLIENRKGHSTPYLSHIKQYVYFIGAIPKVSIFRPQLVKKIVTEEEAKIIFDPCAGWGSRMLGSISAGATHYIGFEPCLKTYEGLNKISEFLNISKNVTLINDSILNYHKYNLPEYDMILTSPPFYNMEIYDHSELQSVNSKVSSYEDWVSYFLEPTIKYSLSGLSKNGTSNWNAVNFGKCLMLDDLETIHNKYSYNLTKIYSLENPTRPSTKKSRKNIDKVKSFKIS